MARKPVCCMGYVPIHVRSAPACAAPPSPAAGSNKRLTLSGVPRPAPLGSGAAAVDKRMSLAGPGPSRLPAGAADAAPKRMSLAGVPRPEQQGAAVGQKRPASGAPAAPFAGAAKRTRM